jgi:hypothetical protein
MEYEIKDSNFLKKSISKKDVNFLLYLQNNNDIWDQVKTAKKKNSQYNTYISKLKFLPEVSFMEDATATKISMTFNEPFEKCLCLVFFIFTNIVSTKCTKIQWRIRSEHNKSYCL